MSKRALVWLLAGVNIFLLGAIIFTVYTPPSALAQAVGARRGEYLLISGRVEVLNDAIYLIDSGNRMVHVFRSVFPRAPNGATDVVHVSSYDLSRDFVGPAGAGRGGVQGQPGVGQAPGQLPGGELLPQGGQQP